MPVEKQIAIIYCGTRGLLKDVPVNKVKEFERDYLEYLENNHRDVLDELAKGNINDRITDTLDKAAAEIAMRFK